jgi:hypothetical protein
VIVKQKREQEREEKMITEKATAQSTKEKA